uniref:Kinesin light chain n=1 Tax=Craspedostauros australis TaxID=1486917 RepID=A0A7R9WPL8_9STRA
MGTIFYQKSNINLAQQLFTESLRIRRLQLGDKHRDVSFTLYNLALCFQLQGRYDDAINCYRETLRIEKAVLGENHKDVSMTMYKLGEVYQLKEDLSEALQYFEAALEIERSTIGRDDPAVMARTLNEIGNIHMSRGEVGKMMEAFSDSARLFEKAGQSIAESIAVPDKLYAFENTCPLASAAA